MVAGILSIVLFIVLLIMMTLGAVLLVKFVMARFSRSMRIFAAAILGPGALVIPSSLFVLTNEEPDMIVVAIVVVFGGLLMSAVVSWPTALIATRRLDRLTQFDLETFE